jgi:uncharacterized protein (TIGR03067 family)
LICRAEAVVRGVAALLLLLVGLPVNGAPAPFSNRRSHGDLVCLRGDWVLQHEGGEKLTMSVAGHRLTLWVGTGIEMTFEIILRPGSPGQIDLTRIRNGLRVPEVILGIYRLEGDRCTLCLGYDKRPAEFIDTRSTSLLVFLRARR